MVDKLLIKDYRQRPDIEEILRHPAMVERMKKLSIELPTSDSLKIAPKKPKEPKMVPIKLPQQPTNRQAEPKSPSQYVRAVGLAAQKQDAGSPQVGYNFIQGNKLPG